MTEATTEVENVETESTEPVSLELPFDLEAQDDVTRAITSQVLVGLARINEANEAWRESKGTKTVDLDKQIKDFKDPNSEHSNILTMREEKDALEAQLKEKIKELRNSFRVDVLHEEAQDEPDVDIELMKASRKVVLDSLTALKGFAEINKNEEVLSWIAQLEIPQVQREGTTVIGQKKARVWVTIGETRYDSFGAAAKGLSKGLSEENAVTSTDLNIAWADSGEANEFSFVVNGESRTIKVSAKETKKEREDREAREAKAEIESAENDDNMEVVEVEND